MTHSDHDKETACPPKRFPDHHSAFDQGGRRRSVNFLAIFDHMPAMTRTASSRPLPLSKGEGWGEGEQPGLMTKSDHIRVNPSNFLICSRGQSNLAFWFFQNERFGFYSNPSRQLGCSAENRMTRTALQNRRKAAVPSSGTAARILNLYFRFALISTREKNSLRGNSEVAWRCRFGHDTELERAARAVRAVADRHRNIGNTRLPIHRCHR